MIELGKRSVNSRAYVASFNFKGADQQKRVKDLSGGERNRVHLAQHPQERRATSCCSTSPRTTSTWTRCARSRRRCSSSPAASWSSRHDRWFLDRIATHMLAFEGDSQVVCFEGNYAGLREGAPRAARPRGRPAAPHQVPQAVARVALRPPPRGRSRHAPRAGRGASGRGLRRGGGRPPNRGSLGPRALGPRRLFHASR